jgi:uncharacterized protein YfbU (UPF0304 family)
MALMQSLTLTTEQRLILYNQYRILAKLYPQEKEDFERVAEIVHSGYAGLYDQELAKGFQEEVPRTVYKEVVAILDMYRCLKEPFEGFSGNDETEHFALADFLIHQLGKWNEQRGVEFDSHTPPMLPQYRRMLAEWEKCRDKVRLTEQEKVKILSTRE